jgi:lysophospholipase L1-like esterase
MHSSGKLQCFWNGALLAMVVPCFVLAITVLPDNAQIQYTGRVEVTAAGAFFYHSGSSARATFRGTSIAATFSEMHYSGGSEANAVGFQIDEGDWKIIQLKDGVANQLVTFATNLSDGVHTIFFMRESDVIAGTLTFHGFTLNNSAQLLSPPPRPSLRIEVYGNSVTSGAYGGEGNVWSSHGAYHNRLGRRLNAEVQSVAAAGLGLNGRFSLFEYYNGSATGLDTFYAYLQPNRWGQSPTLWDFSRFKPHIIIFAIGANDHNRGVESTSHSAWQADYAAVVEKICARYERKPLLLFTQAYGAYNVLDTMIANVATLLKTRGYDAFSYDHNIHPVNNTPLGYDNHPTPLGHQIMADSLYSFFMKNKLLDLIDKTSPVRHNPQGLLHDVHAAPLSPDNAPGAYWLNGRRLTLGGADGSGGAQSRSVQSPSSAIVVVKSKETAARKLNVVPR